MIPFLFRQTDARQWQLAGCKIVREYGPETAAALIHCSTYSSDTSVRLLLIETATGIAHTDLYGRSLLGFGRTDGKVFVQLAYLTIFF